MVSYFYRDHRRLTTMIGYAQQVVSRSGRNLDCNWFWNVFFYIILQALLYFVLYFYGFFKLETICIISLHIVLYFILTTNTAYYSTIFKHAKKAENILVTKHTKMHNNTKKKKENILTAVDRRCCQQGFGQQSWPD